EVSKIDLTNKVNGFPLILTNRARTSVRLHSGENLVIGGLKNTEKNKRKVRVPILGQIPLVGALFTSVRNETTEKNLLILVSPELIQAASTEMPRLPTDRPERK